MLQVGLFSTLGRAVARTFWPLQEKKCSDTQAANGVGSVRNYRPRLPLLLGMLPPRLYDASAIEMPHTLVKRELSIVGGNTCCFGACPPDRGECTRLMAGPDPQGSCPAMRRGKTPWLRRIASLIFKALFEKGLDKSLNHFKISTFQAALHYMSYEEGACILAGRGRHHTIARVLQA